MDSASVISPPRTLDTSCSTLQSELSDLTKLTSGIAQVSLQNFCAHKTGLSRGI